MGGEFIQSDTLTGIVAAEEMLTANLTPEEILQATISSEGELQGEIDPTETLYGEMKAHDTLEATIQIPEKVTETDKKLPRIGEVTLLESAWIGEGNLYKQIVDIEGVTTNSQVDLTPDIQQLVIFYEKDLSFVTENENGVVTVYALGQKPTNDYTIQVTITEVEACVRK